MACVLDLDPSLVTGPGLRAMLCDSRAPTRADVSRAARFAFLLGATDLWTPCRRTFEAICVQIECHLLHTILPMCASQHPWLPNVTGDGWRPDLGVQTGAAGRFTRWLTSVAAFGRLDVWAWHRLHVVKEITSCRVWGPHRVCECYRGLLKKRWALAKECAGVSRRCDAMACAIQRAWRRRG